MYGESGAAMRAELAGLLRQHRIQQRLVGTTAEQREELGGLIRTYRQSVIVWLGQAMRAASPLAFSNMPPAQPNPFRAVGSRSPHRDRSQRTGAGDRHRKTAVERAPRVDGCSSYAQRQPDGGPMAPRRPRSGPR